jgi:prevent-host-death family protein
VAEVDSRVLHNRTDDVLSRAMAGEEIVVSLGGRPVAALVPIKKPIRRAFTEAEMITLLEEARADAGLRAAPPSLEKRLMILAPLV